MSLSLTRRLAFLLAALLTLGVVFAPAAGAAAPSPVVPGLPPFAAPPPWLGTCRDVRLPVTLPTGQAETLAAHRCEPRRGRHNTVLVLVHGATYDSTYWSWPQAPAAHSFTWAALAAGYAVLAVDRLGDGESSRPASALDTFTAQVDTLHQVLQAARRTWPRVVAIGHSFGSSELAQDLATWPGDAAAVAFTGFGRTVSPETTALARSGFAAAITQGSRFRRLTDVGYLTSTTQAVRDQLLYVDTASSPQTRAYDQATRDTVTVGELAGRPVDPALQTRSLAVPTLLLDGQLDNHYCAGAQLMSEVGLDNCATAASLYASERGNFGPCLTAAVVPGSGHDLTTENGASTAARLTLTWLRATAPSEGRGVARCASVGPVHPSGTARPWSTLKRADQ